MKVDSGSSSNIIHWKLVKEMGLSKKSYRLQGPLVVSTCPKETTKREIDLPVKAGGVIKETKFYVINGDMHYNTIFGRLWLHETKVVPSTRHLLLKFPTPEGIRQILGELPESKDMFKVEELEASKAVAVDP
ncbi:uncharacterized protein LOC132057834 [Lycium ferocissimum]|uniref:uncharacterized protein LOC132057834 n=1 Tax=Lycium ferocissimum TaxID=112874 RepID=UPI0028168712|nr:uncharacterized protein LOC132057834 [Lycium ferocissimum]